MVGIGPGGPEHRTAAAVDALLRSTVIVGYRRYLELIADLIEGKETIASGMTEEVERCRNALERATAGETVALISSGDAGIYGMAGLAFELAAAHGIRTSIQIVPGVTAASAAAAALGAPLMLDFAVISLSDLLVPWETIRRRLEAAAAADFVIVLYNPKSRTRTRPFEETVAMLRAVRPDGTPVGIVRDAGRAEQTVTLTDLGRLAGEPVDMHSTVIIGNSGTKCIDGRMVALRGYAV